MKKVSEIQAIVMDFQFWDDVLLMAAVTSVIASHITVLEKENVTLSEVIFVWNIIQDIINKKQIRYRGKTVTIRMQEHNNQTKKTP